MPRYDYTPLPGDDESSTTLVRSFLSDIQLSWVTPLLNKGYSKPLDASDLGKMPRTQQARHVASRGARDLWIKPEASGDAPDSIRLVKTLVKLFGVRLITMTILRAALITISLLVPFYFIPQVLQCLNPRSDGPALLSSSATALAGLLFVVQVLQAVISNRLQLLALDNTVDITATLTAALYAKSLRLSPGAGAEFTPAKILSMTSSDVTKLSMFANSCVGLVTAPAHICVCSFLLSKLLGHVVWVPISLFLLFIALQTPIGQSYGTAIWGYLEAMDARVNVVREFLYAIKMVKYSATEGIFEKRVQETREKQTPFVRLYCFVIFALASVKQLQEVVIPVATFVVFASVAGGEMSGSTPFVVLGLFATLNTPFTEITDVIANLAPARVSLVRIEEFLNTRETTMATGPKRLPFDNSGPAVNLKNASFAYDSTTGFRLEDLDLSFKQGTTNAIVGAVGAGKSSLLAALAGGGVLSLTKGSASVAGNVAYCGQDPWILAGTVRENVLLKDNPKGNEAHLESVITACQLDHDISQLSHGIDTYIGEKGVNLSGGQKARVALARAVYSTADVVLLDDPLQALDARTGRCIFDDLICGPLLEKKLVIMATHHLHLLPRVDRIVVMDAGRIVQQGTFAELKEEEGGALAAMVRDYKFDSEVDKQKDEQEEIPLTVTGDANSDNLSNSEPTPAMAAQTAIEEDRQKGVITASTISSYFRNAGGAVFVATVIVGTILLSISMFLSQTFLSWWASDAFHWSSSRYVRTYAAVGGFAACTSLLLIGVIAAGSARAACAFHDDAWKGLVRAPLAFFERQPVGRLLSRLGTDVKDVDMNFPMTFVDLFAAGCELLAALAIIASNRGMLLAFVALAAIYGTLFVYYQRSFRELKRLQSVMKSPLSAHISETLANLPSIRAYGVQEVFSRICQEKTDDANISVFFYNATRLWFLLRLSTLSACVTFAVVILAPFSTSSMTAISVTAAINLSSVLINYFVALGRTEAMFNAVERLNHYSNGLPSEAPKVQPNDPTSADWVKGSIEMKELSLRYEGAGDDQLAISNLSLAIRAGEKIGVCGRTGSGKSTLVSALFRLMEPHAGRISIDGVDISTLGLQTLRSAITMVAQDPTLISGTVRSNLLLRNKGESLCADDDDKIWAALDRVGLRNHVKSLPNQLNAEIVEGGSNWSAGQRQLLCLARAVLESSRIVVLDEASSSLDAASDAIIQEFVAKEIPDTTVISVAHRLNSICGLDRVLVLDGGRIVEFAPPWELLEREEISEVGFASLVRATGPANEKAIRALANAAYAKRQA
ncbi:hypothetical protein HDU86_006371 [Geranomyces michiganensis]|nr:hypothetical protein HDU86_006371 [Geranomyces michiganensis]